MKILVIEDQPAELTLARQVLAAEGHKVAGATAAEYSFQRIKEEKPDIILLDMNLPGMDGLTLARKLKADEATRNIHIVAVTSFPERFSRAKALEAGCDAYLVKPLSTRTLPQQLNEVLAAEPDRHGPSNS